MSGGCPRGTAVEGPLVSKVPLEETSVTVLAKMKLFYRDICAPPFGYQTTETMNPTRLALPQESHAERADRGPGASRGEFVSQEETSQDVDNLSDHLAGETERRK